MDLYGLIHARFILTPRGLAMMKEKYMLSAFSYCPRVLCERHNVLPIGVSEELSTSRVKVYCPRCQDVYIPRQKQLDIDGAYFGTSFPHIFLKQFPELLPKGPAKFVPKIYGFKIFGMRGSKYELKFDYQGKPVNEDEIRRQEERLLEQQKQQVADGGGIEMSAQQELIHTIQKATELGVWLHTEFQCKMEEADALMAKEAADEKKPYEEKYQARELLKNLKMSEYVSEKYTKMPKKSDEMDAENLSSGDSVVS